MNENLKLILIAAGVLAAYHFLFRSISPVQASGEPGESIADGLNDAPDYDREDDTHISVTPDRNTSIDAAAARGHFENGFSKQEMSQERTEFLQG
jgi:hypothetical protein